MSTLTALKLQRELAIARRSLIVTTDRPALACQWTLDPQSGRPVSAWSAVSAHPMASVLQEPVFG